MLKRLAERNFIPERFFRWWIRRLLARRVEREWARHLSSHGFGTIYAAQGLADSSEPLLTAYPLRLKDKGWGSFARLFLGEPGYFGCGFWADDSAGYSASVEAMFQLIVKRAGIHESGRVLTIGEPFGTFARWLLKNKAAAEAYTLVHNAEEKSWVEESLHNIKTQPQVFFYDRHHPGSELKFDRIVYLSGIEREQNFEQSFEYFADLLAPGGKLLAQYFCHRKHCYSLRQSHLGPWIAKNFFAPTLMPSEDFLLHFQKRLGFEKLWRINGRHFCRTLAYWKQRFEAEAEPLQACLAEMFGEKEGRAAAQRLKYLLIAAQECFGYRNGEEWYVVQQLFDRM